MRPESRPAFARVARLTRPRRGLYRPHRTRTLNAPSRADLPCRWRSARIAATLPAAAWRSRHVAGRHEGPAPVAASPRPAGRRMAGRRGAITPTAAVRLSLISGRAARQRRPSTGSAHLPAKPTGLRALRAPRERRWRIEQDHRELKDELGLDRRETARRGRGLAPPCRWPRWPIVSRCSETLRRKKTAE
jgi:hypothetical protein